MFPICQVWYHLHSEGLTKEPFHTTTHKVLNTYAHTHLPISPWSFRSNSAYLSVDCKNRWYFISQTRTRTIETIQTHTHKHKRQQHQWQHLEVKHVTAVVQRETTQRTFEIPSISLFFSPLSLFLIRNETYFTKDGWYICKWGHLVPDLNPCPIWFCWIILLLPLSPLHLSICLVSFSQWGFCQSGHIDSVTESPWEEADGKERVTMAPYEHKRSLFTPELNECVWNRAGKRGHLLKCTDAS